MVIPEILSTVLSELAKTSKTNVGSDNNPKLKEIWKTYSVLSIRETLETLDKDKYFYFFYGSFEELPSGFNVVDIKKYIERNGEHPSDSIKK